MAALPPDPVAWLHRFHTDAIFHARVTIAWQVLDREHGEHIDVETVAKVLAVSDHVQAASDHLQAAPEREAQRIMGRPGGEGIVGMMYGRPGPPRPGRPRRPRP
jgi:hypothetical protein